MSEKQKSVLFIEWATKGRDFEIALPLMYYFERILQWEVYYESIFNLNRIVNKHPDIVIMSNTTGGIANVKMTRFIHKSNFFLFSHVSEGLFREHSINGMFWGWNEDEVLYEEFTTLWSQKAYTLTVKNINGIGGKIRITGSIGHDKYKMYEAKKVKITGYKKIVGYGCFDFSSSFRKRATAIKTRGEEWFNLNISYIEKINKIFRYLVKHNPDILFLMKNHPGHDNEFSHELRGLEHYDNVMTISNEFSIVDIINTSDVWFSYRSSTNLEAWCLNKPSISFCTDDTILEDSEICYGSILCQDEKTIQIYLDEYYEHGSIADFQQKAELRKKIINEMIGYNDGFNHVRFLSFLKPYIDGKIKKEGKWKINMLERVRAGLKSFVYVLAKNKYNIPLLNRWAWGYRNFNRKDIEYSKRIRYPEFDRFYVKHKERINKIYTTFAESWEKNIKIRHF